MMHAVRSFTGGTSIGGIELGVGYLLLTAFFMGKVFNRFGLPKLNGYIIARVIAGPYVLGLVTPEMGKSLKIVSNVATCVIALTAGSELNFKRLRPSISTLRAMTVFAVVFAQFAIAAAVFVMRPLLSFFTGDVVQDLAICFVIGVALSAQSPAVVMALLAETGAEGPLSTVILGSVVLADLVVLFMYSAAASIAGAVVGGGINVVETALS